MLDLLSTVAVVTALAVGSHFASLQMIRYLEWRHFRE
jgi:hypothetical protein